MRVKKLRILRRDTRPRGDGLTAEPAEVRLRTWLIAIFLLVGPPILLWLYCKTMFPGLTNTDALDFAQLGRNLSAGRGFVTYVIRPLAMSFGENPLKQPDVMHGPLYPFILALAFGVGGTNDHVVAMVSGLFYILTIPVLFVLGMRLFNRTVGMVTALVYVFNALILEYASSGLHVTLYIFLTTSLLLVLYNLATYEIAHIGQPVVALPRTQLVMVGLLTSLLYLTEPVFLWVLPVVLIYAVYLCRSRWIKAIGWCFLPVLVTAVPWMIRNGMVTGNPFFGLRGLELVMNTETYPRWETYRMMPTEISQGISLVDEVLRKLARSVGEVLYTLPTINASYLLAFFLPALLFRLANPAANIVRGIIVAIGFALLWGTVIFQIDMPLFVALIPAAILFAIAFLVHLMAEAQLSRPTVALVSTIGVLVIALPLVYDTQLRVQKVEALGSVGVARALSDMTRRQDVCLSDHPWVVAWYADRPAIWIPKTDGNVMEFRKQFASARWLFLTESSREYSAEWRTIYDVFLRWNVVYNRAKESKRQPPTSIRINGKGHPLLEGLQGFTSVEPRVKGEPKAVIATVTNVTPRTGAAGAAPAAPGSG